MISEVKLLDYDFVDLEQDVKKVTDAVINFESDYGVVTFEEELYQKMADFNNRFFPSPEFKERVYHHEINESEFSAAKEKEFLKIYSDLVKKFKINLKQDKHDKFLDNWYVSSVRKEIDSAFEVIKKIKDVKNKKILAVILSRTIRSCRATTHSDLATLKEPQITTYYCFKHKKICKPIFSIKDMFVRYANDTIDRLNTISKQLLNTALLSTHNQEVVSWLQDFLTKN